MDSHELALQLLALPAAPVLLSIRWPNGSAISDSDEPVTATVLDDEGFARVLIEARTPEKPEFSA